MNCPNCNAENNESAKFCKKCGSPLTKKVINHETVINSMNKEKESSDNTTKYIIIALIIIAIALAGVFAYLGFNNSGSDSNQAQTNNNQASGVSDASQSSSQSEPAKTSESSSSQSTSKPLEIKGGTFSTGSSLSDKTYASINVGKEHAGENVKIQIKYSRDGSSLNKGNMVPKTVESDGYIHVKSADAYKYYPDFAEINIFDTSGNLLDTQSVSLSPDSSTQSF